MQAKQCHCPQRRLPRQGPKALAILLTRRVKLVYKDANYRQGCNASSRRMAPPPLLAMQVPHESPDMVGQARVSLQADLSIFGCAPESLDYRLLLVLRLAGEVLVFACSNSSLKEPHLKHRSAIFAKHYCRERLHV